MGNLRQAAFWALNPNRTFMPAGHRLRARTRGKPRGTGQKRVGTQPCRLSGYPSRSSWAWPSRSPCSGSWGSWFPSARYRIRCWRCRGSTSARLVRDSDTQEIARVKPEIKKIEPPPSPQNVSTNTKASVAAGLDSSNLAPAGVDFGSGEGGLRQGGGAPVGGDGGRLGPRPRAAGAASTPTIRRRPRIAASRAG